MKIKKTIVLLVVFLFCFSLLAIYKPYNGVTAALNSSSNFILTEITNLIPPQVDYLTSWAEDAQYLYIAGVKKNSTVYVYKIDKSTEQVTESFSKDIDYVDYARVGYKWNKIYVITYSKVDDTAIDTPVYWNFYQLETNNVWNKIWSTQHKEGGFTNYLISTNHYIYVVGYYSSCCAWGTKIVRIDQNNDYKLWSSPTGTEFYNPQHGFTTGDKIIFYHQSAFTNPLLFEDYSESYNNWLSTYTNTGYEGDRAGVFEINGKIFFLCNVINNSAYNVHFIDYPLTTDKTILSTSYYMNFMEPLLTSTGKVYYFAESSADKSYYIFVLNNNMDAQIYKTQFSWNNGDIVGWKFMHAIDDNPGFTVSESNGKKFIYSLKPIFNKITTGNYNFSNVSTASNEFQMWLDISINGGAPKDVDSNYEFKVESGNETGSIEEIKCEDEGAGRMPNSERYRVWFTINPQGHAAYFENATIKMYRKDDPSKTYTLKGLNSFSVYGTTFDMEKNAWRFYNDAWVDDPNPKDPKLNELLKAVDVISWYISFSQRVKLWAMFEISKILGKNKISSNLPAWSKFGVCYGMANAAIANFCNSGSDYWGDVDSSGGIEETNKEKWKENIENHWESSGNPPQAKSPYKPFPEDNIYSSKYTRDSNHYDDTNNWTVEAARKIAYYFVSQSGFKPTKGEEKSWIGKDKNSNPSNIINENSEDEIISILKEGIPLSIGLSLKGYWYFDKNGDWKYKSSKGSHQVVITELIAWNNHRRYIVWDNDYDYPEGGLETPPCSSIYEEWYIGIASDYNKSFNDYNGEYFGFTDIEDGSDNEHVYELAQLPTYLSPSGDSQGIYGLGPYYSGPLSSRNNSSTNNASNVLTSFNSSDSSNKDGISPYVSSIYAPLSNTQATREEDQIQYPYPHHIEVLIIGGKVDSVKDKNTGEDIPLVPQGDIEEGKASIITTTAGTFNEIYLPADKTYRIKTTKYASMPFLKIYVTIPNGDGTGERLNYEHVEQSEDDATHVYFFVGKNNPDKSIKYITTSSSSNNNGNNTSVSSSSEYAPDYDNTVQISVLPPTNFSGIYTNNAIHLSWDNPDNARFAGVEVIRKIGSFPNSPTDGTVIYQGSANQIYDTSVSPNTLYFYAIYSKDNSSNLSDPAYTSVDTGRFSIYGNVTANSAPLQSASIEVRDSSGNVVGDGVTDANGHYTVSNLTNGNYTVDISSDGYSFNPSEVPVTINNQNVEQDFTGTATPLLSLLFDNNSSVAIGNTVFLQWTYRNIDNNDHINIELNRGNGWETVARNVPILNGNYNWTVISPVSSNAILRISLAENSSVYDEATVNITIASLTITTISLPNGIVDTSYSVTLQATGGTGTYTWSITSGNLPDGLTLNSSTGVISGTPTTAGTYSFTVQVSDGAQSTTRSLSIEINPIIAASATSGGSIIPSGNVSVDYGGRQTFTITSDPGYLISKVLVDGKPIRITNLYKVVYIFRNVTKDHTILAEFVATPDTTPPTIGGISGINLNASSPEIKTNKDTFTFTVNAYDKSGIARMVVKVNGITQIDKDNLDPTIHLSEGINDVDVIIYDSAGNFATASFKVICDTKPPVIDLTLPETVASPVLTIKGKAYDQVTGIKTVTVNGNPANVTLSGNFKATLTLSEGTNNITVKAIDKLGNASVRTFKVTYTKSASATSIMIILKIGSPYITVNGVSNKIDAQGSKPIIKDSRTFLPIRTLIESLGGTVEWNAKEQKVMINLNGHSIILWIGKTTALVDGNKATLDVAPFILNGRTYLPLRFIAEHLNAVVDWQASTQTITIYYWP